MSSLVLLPNQLFEKAEDIDTENTYLVEDERFFQQFNFHKKKLVLHRASMKAFQDKIDAEYIEFDEGLEKVFEKEDEIKFFDPVDHELSERIERLSEKHKVDVEVFETPMFVNEMDWNREYFSENKYFQLDYYKQVRKKHGILVEDGKPVGGKWSYDPENRKKLPEDMETPEGPDYSNEYVQEAVHYVKENFSENPGEIEDFFYPTTHEEALDNLEKFLEEKMVNFGPYQDAIDEDLKFGFHSLISSSINIGLLTPEQVVEVTLEKHEERDYPMQSLEGFLRQIIGWREYIRALYELEGKKMRERNYFGCENEMPEQFYTAQTGIPPVDVSIENVLQNAYGHHIERLMVLGNMMLLLEIDPDEVYDWFMELFIDSYDWVMVPNVYGMSQYADPRIMTKPYISSSNYIRKMSHYSKGDWCESWDGLYWRFIDKHKEKISENYRMKMMVSTLERMNEETVEEHRENAEEYKESLDLNRGTS